MTTAELLAFMREYPMAVQASVAAAEGVQAAVRGHAGDRGRPARLPQRSAHLSFRTARRVLDAEHGAM
jgi:hypothetical protein